jgi:hypothetical protein
MKIKLEFSDLHSFTREEAIDRMKTLLGKSTTVEVLPETNSVEDMLRFVLQQMIGYDQLCLLHDSSYNYDKQVLHLKEEVLARVENELDSIVKANECKFNE